MRDKEMGFVDTNILVYSFYGKPEEKERIGALLKKQISPPVISIQVLKEFTNVSLKM